MLGKLIKYEFINRWKAMISVFAGLIGGSLVVALLRVIRESAGSSFMNGLFGLVSALYVVGMLLGLGSIFILPLYDFRQRFFKDQGYLTHTLPVKTGTLLVSRIACDLSMLVGMIIVFPLSLCIAVGNFDVFRALADMVNTILKMIGINAAFGLTVGLFCGLILIEYLFNTWCFNCAYTLGHCLFEKGKKIMSVLFYIAIVFITGNIATLIANGFKGRIESYDYVSDIARDVAFVNLILTVMIVLMAVFVVGLMAITNRVFKKRLNLE